MDTSRSNPIYIYLNLFIVSIHNRPSRIHMHCLVSLISIKQLNIWFNTKFQRPILTPDKSPD